MRYVRCWLGVEEAVWFWLAKIIRGKSQQDRIKRGVDKGSVPISVLRVDHPISEGHLNHNRLRKAIVRLWVSADDHNHLAGVSQIVGMSIIVGVRIISIVEC